MKQKPHTNNSGTAPEAEQKTKWEKEIRELNYSCQLLHQRRILDITLTNRAFLLGVAAICSTITNKHVLPSIHEVGDFYGELERMLEACIDN